MKATYLIVATLAVALPGSSVVAAAGPNGPQASIAEPISGEAPMLRVPPVAYTITYDVRYAAFGGDITMELQRGDAPGQYVVRARTHPRGLTRLFAPKLSQETARFRFADGQVYSEYYELDDGTKKGEHDNTIVFDWQAQTATSIYEGEKVTLPLRNRVFDRISADVVTMLELRSGREPATLSIAEKNRIRNYEFTYRGKDTVTVPAGTYATVKYLRQRPGSSRSVLIWYAPDAMYLPVRIEQLKRGKTNVTSVATEVTWSETGPAGEMADSDQTAAGPGS